MRQWISVQREALRSAVGLRRALINAGAFDGLPFTKRLWQKHLQFIRLLLRPVKMQAGSAITLLFWRIEQCYCRTADRFVGGERYKAFVQRCAGRHEETVQKLQEGERRLQEIAEARFGLRLLEESLTNPHFVATPHTHQDR